MFKKAQGIVDDEETERLAQLEKQQETRAQETFNILEKARQDANVPAAELQALKNQVVADLGLLADQGSETALRLRGELLAEPPNVDYTLYRQYREGIAQGQRPSEAQIAADVQKGLLSPQMGEELKVYATGSDRNDFMKQFGSSFKEAVTAHLRQAGAISLNPFGQPLQHTQHVNQTINDLADSVYKVYDAEKRKGNTLEDQDINQLIQNLIPRTVGRYFQQDPTTKSWKTRQISRDPAVSPDRVRTTLGTYVPDAGGFNPRTIQIRRYDAGTTRQLTKPEVEDNIRRLQSGQPPTARAATLAASTPNGLLPLLTNQARLNGVDPSPILNSPQAQQFAEFRSVAPRAADSLSRSTDYRSQLLQLRRITEAQQRAARLREMGNDLGPAVDLQPGARVGMREYIQLGLSQGLSPEQAILMGAVGMAESTGDSGVIRNRPDTGDLSYGMWQINMLGNLGPARLRQFGLRSADDLKDPETNAKAMATLLRGSGVSAWGAYNDKRYLQYMSEARRVYAQLQSQGFNSARGGRANFTPTNVQSIRIETPGNSFQPGIDLWFADKQFGAVLPGRVKEIRTNNGNYGNMIVVESIDTKTGQPVDVVYSHLESINVREGQRIAPGTVIGRQGGTGRVRSADGTIASVDFLAPAPRGSNSMTPYRRWQQLAQEIKTRIESGSFR